MINASINSAGTCELKSDLGGIEMRNLNAWPFYRKALKSDLGGIEIWEMKGEANAVIKLKSDLGGIEMSNLIML